MIKKLSFILLATVLAGCGTPSFNETASKVEKSMTDVEKTSKENRGVERKSISFEDSSYVPMRKMARSEYSMAQRKVLDTEIEVNREFNSLYEVASWVTSVASYPVYLNPELTVPQQTNGVGAGVVGQPIPQIGVPTLGQGAFGTAQGLQTIASRKFSVTYSGTVTGFLDIVGANYGIYWKLDGGDIRLLLTDSRTFRIKALPGDTQLNSVVGSNSSSSGNTTTTGVSTQTGTSQNTTGISFSGLSVWTGIESAVKQLLTPVTGRVSVTPSTGTISVTDTPRVLERVAEYVKEQNASLSRQVSVNVRLLSIEISNSDNYGINWKAVYNNLSDNVGVSVNSAFQAATGSANFVVSTSTPSSGNWAASSGAIINALSTQGHVSELTEATVVTLNNQPAPVNVGRQVSYLASSATTQTANVGSTTSLTPGVVQTGFSMVVVPHILDGKEVLLQSSINVSSLIQLSTITSGTSSIQSPDLSTSNFIQRVRMNSGETLVLAGFDQDNLSAVASGVGSATNPVFGNRSTNGKRTMLVVLIQPTVSM